MIERTAYPGIDCAVPLTAKNCADLVSLGYTWAGRYLVPNSGSTAWKALTKAEAQRITAAGMKILSVFELSEDRVKGGAQAGFQDGTTASRLASQIGQPEDSCIYFAVDYDAQSADYDTIKSYLWAAKQAVAPYRCGVYAGYRVIEHLAKQNACDCYWQTVAWSYGKKSQYRNAYQGVAQTSVAGVGVDINECENPAAAGLWDYKEGTYMLEISKTELENLIDKAVAAKVSETLTGTDTAVSTWAKTELEEAKAAGITDGTRPGGYVTREQAAIMALRASKK